MDVKIRPGTHVSELAGQCYTCNEHLTLMGHMCTFLLCSVLLRCTHTGTSLSLLHKCARECTEAYVLVLRGGGARFGDL